MRESKTLTKFSLIVLGILILLSAIFALLSRSVIGEVVSRFYLEVPENWYFVPQYAYHFYLLTPLVILNAIFLWFLPGGITTLILGKAQRWEEFIFSSFTFSFILYVILISLIKLLWVSTPAPIIFVLGVIIVTVIGWLTLFIKVIRGGRVISPFSDIRDLRRLLWTLAIPLVPLLVMYAHFFWQEMNSDGLEALEIGRSLSTFILPRFPTASGVLGLGVGMLPMAFPVHWFVSLYGPVEVAARLPLLLYLIVLFNLLLIMIEYKSDRLMSVWEESLLILGLCIYTVTMSYSASYDPYIADIAAPAAFETLTIICLLASIYFVWRQNLVGFLFFSILSFLCRPTGLLVLALLLFSVILVLPDYRKRWTPIILLTILACFVLAFSYDRWLIPTLSGTTNFGYKTAGLIERVRYIRLFEPFRFNFAIFPTGILPFLSLFYLKWQDRYARSLTVITLLYFFMFLFFAYTSLHHFVPVMIIPLIVFWRMIVFHPQWNRRIILPVIALAGLVSLVFSLPQGYTLSRSFRTIGEKTLIRIGDYDGDFQNMMKYEKLFWKLFPPDWLVKDRSTELVSTPITMIYYGTRPKQSAVSINYIVQPIEYPAPAGFSKIAVSKEAAIYVRDLNEYQVDRFQKLRTQYVSKIYTIPWGTLFNFWRDDHGTRVFDLLRIPAKLYNLIK